MSATEARDPWREKLATPMRGVDGVKPFGEFTLADIRFAIKQCEAEAAADLAKAKEMRAQAGAR